MASFPRIWEVFKTMKEDLFEKRLLDLAGQSYGQGRYTFSNFLDLYEQSVLASMHRRGKLSSYDIFGGYEGAQRCMVRFGSQEELGYEQEYPMSLLHIGSLSGKFAEALSHRDYLGSLMNLGIERNLIGDILVMDKEAYVFVKDAIGPFLMQEWTKVRHTWIEVTEVPIREFSYTPSFEEIRGFCSSFRVDVMVAFFCKTSRKESADLIKGQKVFVNSCLIESNSVVLKVGDVLSVRGFGKAIFEEVGGQSKKGRCMITMKKYI